MAARPISYLGFRRVPVGIPTSENVVHNSTFQPSSSGILADWRVVILGMVTAVAQVDMDMDINPTAAGFDLADTEARRPVVDIEAAEAEFNPEAALSKSTMDLLLTEPIYTRVTPANGMPTRIKIVVKGSTTHLTACTERI
ncbi:hypothetical protein FRB97_004557 [Tulasnella sp. 331]|nr:hypothetical protein FRB97_004557 [Tulasnella sp. 331]KAG8884797.1 hypothetical protein FRB98_002156 [Tulasnella sp. 332]